MEYKEAYKVEGHGGPCGSFGMKILVSFPREINENDKRMLYKHIDQIESALMKESVRLDPKTAERNAKDKAEFISLFDQPIFVEEIPNGYGPEDWWYSNFPWYQITTKIGRIKIGWRKRVINIDWTDTIVKQHGGEIIMDDVTKSGPYDKERYCHAWSIDKAREYIQILMRYANVPEGSGSADSARSAG